MKRNLFVANIIPAKQYNVVERQVRKDHRKFIWGTYIRTTWFIQLLILLVPAGGIVGSYFLLKEFQPAQAVIISMFLVFVFLLPFWNYISKLQEMMFVVLLPIYESTFATLTLEFISKYRDKIGIEEEDVKKIEELLNSMNKTNEKKEENKEDETNLEDK